MVRNRKLGARKSDVGGNRFWSLNLMCVCVCVWCDVVVLPHSNNKQFAPAEFPTIQFISETTCLEIESDPTG